MVPTRISAFRKSSNVICTSELVTVPIFTYCLSSPSYVPGFCLSKSVHILPIRNYKWQPCCVHHGECPSHNASQEVMCANKADLLRKIDRALPLIPILTDRFGLH